MYRHYKLAGKYVKLLPKSYDVVREYTVGAFLLGRKFEGSSLLFDKGRLVSQKSEDGNVFLVVEKGGSRGFLHTGETFIDFVRIGYLSHLKCYISRESDRQLYCVSSLGDSHEKPVTANRIKASGWETFDMLPAKGLSQSALETLEIIEEIYFKSPDLTYVFNKVLRSDLRDKSKIFEKLVEIMSVKDKAYIAYHLSQNTSEIVKLAEASGDILFKTFVSDTFNSNKNVAVIDEKLDFLSNQANASFTSKNSWVELIHNLRKISPPKYKSCIVATCKNEVVYLIEWIAYHLSIGFDAIFIYSNGNDDGSDELLESLHNAGFIYYIKNIVGEGASAQDKAYAHALTVNKEVLNYEWSLFIDVDEFFVLNEFMFSSLADYLDWQNRSETDAIALNWLFSKPVENSDWINSPITKRLPHFNKEASAHIKTFFKPHKFSGSSPHFPLCNNNYKYSYRTSSRDIHEKSIKKNDLSFTDNPKNSHAYVIHYFNRSIPEFIWKYSRNRGNLPNVKGGSHFTEQLFQFLKFFTSALDSTQFVENQSLMAMGPVIDDKISELLSNENILSAHENVKSQTKERYDRIEPLFWDFLKSNIDSENHKDSISEFISRFSPSK